MVVIECTLLSSGVCPAFGRTYHDEAGFAMCACDAHNHPFMCCELQCYRNELNILQKKKGVTAL
jgi:hypothetical protein